MKRKEIETREQLEAREGAEIVSRLQNIMNIERWTQDKLAQKMNFSYATINRYFNEHHVPRGLYAEKAKEFIKKWEK